ncbi:phosphoenolpyruvate carboxykinase [Hyphobacterium sp. SN044]|uniref:phosphoenolpyruvate carboxykinase n=1 Tax=Hyphobacterium sp. SN044 TaxID=2912575 RepID=UPI001F02CABC|nr:phosphoenolpyruvate carboxykinase [Hyphobacterium sp. SN044]MCF8878599.1 phosphoenolpyruvate carboxykinase [Hyphobacterium sp. SN044]
MSSVATNGQATGLEHLGVEGAAAVYRNLNEAALYQEAVKRGEGEIAEGGPLVVKTGAHTGRSANDKFTVRDETTEDTVWWEKNASMTSDQFAALWEDFKAHMKGKELFVQDLFGGADLDHRLPVTIVNELAWHNLFIRHLLRRPEAHELNDFEAQFTIVNLPSFKADPARHGCRSETIIAVDFNRRMVLIGGTSYAGETKKSVFTILNYLLPAKGVMPMHCSVNTTENDNAAIFFGLSGTGKTTLSADASRTLVGDDEHGWSENGLFNFEGGCYAKMIRLSAEAEPEIFATTKQWGTVLENVVMDPVTRKLDLDDATLAENSRGAYPIHAIPNASATGRCGQPKNLVMLTCDAYGVMPPIAKLTPAQAMYHFLSGYTAKVAGTEKGVKEPTATFSACFGGPFMPRHPAEYGALLRELIAEHGVDCWLVNTGWTSGAYGTGHRMPIKVTRTLLNAALDGTLKNATYREDPNFGFMVPTSVPGVEDQILNPRSTWADGDAYDVQAARLAAMFIENFGKYEDHVAPYVIAAAPRVNQAALSRVAAE